MSRLLRQGFLLLALALAGCGGGPSSANHPPRVTLIAADACVLSGDSVAFTANGTDADGDVLTYSWNFGDVTTETGGTTANHTYTTTGKYTARVTVSDGEDTAQATLDVYVDLIMIHGKIVDQSGQGVAGVQVSCEAGETVSSGDGSFTYDRINPGAVPATYHLTGLGGSAAHYVAAKDFAAASGDHEVLGNITAYKLLGCGVVIESGGTKSLPGAIAPELKRIDPAGLHGDQFVWAKPSGQQGLTKAFDPLTNAILIYLNWAKVADRSVTHYHVYFLGATTESVWDSSAVNLSKDPSPNDGQGNIQAYLDLDDELAAKITTAGEYQFQVVGCNDTHAVMVSLPAITVSLGQILDNYPTGIGCVPAGSHHLVWTAPGGEVAGYVVRIYKDTWYNKVQDSGTALLTANAYDIVATGMTAGYYKCTVDARALDDTGWTAEITRGIGGFTY